VVKTEKMKFNWKELFEELNITILIENVVFHFILRKKIFRKDLFERL